MNNLPKPNPVSAWAFLGIGCCCPTFIWTYISNFQVATSINTILGTERVQGWAILVPIYGNLHISEMAKALNEIIEKEKLDVQPIQENMILNFVFFPLTLFWVYKGNEDVVNAIEAKSK